MVYDIMSESGEILNSIEANSEFAVEYATSIGAIAKERVMPPTSNNSNTTPAEAIRNILSKISEIETMNDTRDAMLIEHEYQITIMTETGGA